MLGRRVDIKQRAIGIEDTAADAVQFTFGHNR